MDFDFGVLVDVDVDDHLVLVGQILDQIYVDIGVLESFVVEVFLDYSFGAVYYVDGYGIAFHKLQAFLNILALCLFSCRCS